MSLVDKLQKRLYVEGQRCKNTLCLYQNVDIDCIPLISDYLKKNDHVYEVMFFGDFVPIETAKTFVDVVVSHKKIWCLILAGNNLHDYGIGLISPRLFENDCIKQLCLDNNKIGDNGISTISKLIQHNRTMQKLYLSGNAITIEGFVVLFDSLCRNTSLDFLNIEQNDADVKEIVELGKKMKRKRYLEIKCQFEGF